MDKLLRPGGNFKRPEDRETFNLLDTEQKNLPAHKPAENAMNNPFKLFRKERASSETITARALGFLGAKHVARDSQE